MKDVTGLFVVVLTLLMGVAGGIEPESGYCIGTQCFAVYKDPVDFHTARDQCRDQRGHLMTVRSTVSRDILYVLLGNFTERFWIGLYRPTRCPDAASRLHGFQWVTKDTESDYDNWPPSFDSSCSSRQCVSVSHRDDFIWTPEPCDERAAGFLCEYTFTEPCKVLTVAQGESVTYNTTMGFVGEDVLSLPPGSTAVRMPGETKYVCFGEQWLQAPWSCDIIEGGCEHKCAEDPENTPFCYCPAGQSVSPTNKVTCEVIPDDPCLTLRCAHACYKDGDSYACTCDHGFKLAQDGRSCMDFNDCRDERQCPGDNFVCVNNVGGFQCLCRDGYKLIGGLCVDVDECVSAPCEHMCDNTPGSYKCSCYDGYKPDPESPSKCKLHCGKEKCDAECDPNNKFHCYCPDGYLLEHAVCIDIDECTHYFCHQGCRNTFGSYVCSCSPGYTLVGQYRCVRNEGDPDTDGQEGSGLGTTPPSIPSVSVSVPVPNPDPTRRPSGVSVGAFVGIIMCTVFLIVLVVCLAHHFLGGRGKMESSKAPEGEAHGLHHVASDA